MTITTPAGNKVRTQSSRRFVVIADVVDHRGRMSARIEKRSDNLQTAGAFVQRKGNFFGPIESRVLHIFDTVEGRFV